MFKHHHLKLIAHCLLSVALCAFYLSIVFNSVKLKSIAQKKLIVKNETLVMSVALQNLFIRP